MKMPEEVRQQFRKYGKRGGVKRAQNQSPEQRIEHARNAAVKRWAKRDKNNGQS